MDEYNPRTGQWRQLDDAPHSRDHFHAAVIGNRLYAAGGRRTADDQRNTFGDTVKEVDVYDFPSESWLPSNLTPDDLPDPRAAAATAVFDGKVIIAGGESTSLTLAHSDVHALDPATGQWERLDSLKHARHGTQAIVSGRGVYVTAGSWRRGNGNQKNMEVYNEDAPAGVGSVAGSLTSSSTVDILFGAPRPVTLQQNGGNQGIFVTSITLTGPQASNFVITGGFSSPILIPNGQTHDVFVQYNGSQDNAQAQLLIIYSGSQVRVVNIVGRRSGQPPSPTPPSPTPPAPTPSTSPLAIADLIIVNAATNADISSVDACSGCLTTSTLMSIRAEASAGRVGSVRLVLSGPESKTQLENSFPYTLYGDNGVNYNGETLDPGTYTITAQAFSLSGMGGAAGPVLTKTFSV